MSAPTLGCVVFLVHTPRRMVESEVESVGQSHSGEHSPLGLAGSWGSGNVSQQQLGRHCFLHTIEFVRVPNLNFFLKLTMPNPQYMKVFLWVLN